MKHIYILSCETDGGIYHYLFENGEFQGKGAEYNEKGVMVDEGGFFSGIHHGTGTSYYNSGIKKYEGDYSVHIWLFDEKLGSRF